MPKKKIAEIVPDAKAPAGKARVRVIPSAVAKPRPSPVPSGPPLLPGFENKVGRYELIRVDGDQAYYSFTNRLGKTVDAIMSSTMWRRMQERADTTFKEIA